MGAAPAKTASARTTAPLGKYRAGQGEPDEENDQFAHTHSYAQFIALLSRRYSLVQHDDLARMIQRVLHYAMQ